MTEAEILAHLLARPRPEDDSDTDLDTRSDIGADLDTVGVGTESAADCGTDAGGLDETCVAEHGHGDQVDPGPTDEDSPDGDASDVGTASQDSQHTAGRNSASDDRPEDSAEENSAHKNSAHENSAHENSADENSADENPAGANLADTGAAGEFPGDGVRESRSGSEPASAPDAGTAAGAHVAAAFRDVADRSTSRDRGAAEDRWCGERVGIREGIEIRVGLATLLGRDQRPGEIPGLGPVDADVARRAVATQRRGGEWQFAVVDPDGYLLLAGPLRRRPRYGDPPGSGPPGRVGGGVVEIHLTLAELHRFAADPDGLGGWAGVLAEIADRWAERRRLRERLSRDPHARFARGGLARHVRVRDRTCVGPGCTRSARRSDLDHTREHGRGGATVEANVGPACWRHHADKDRGWTLTQPEPGQFVWRSPLGRTYRTRGEPIRPDLPDPEPPADGADPRDHPDDAGGRPLNLRILWRPARDPTPLPPPPPEHEEEVPPF